MSGYSDYSPYERYTVAFTFLDGSVEERRVLTNRGPAKAAHMASLAMSRKGHLALSVSVSLDGPVELDRSGLPRTKGYGMDRNEW
jgi:hypothetical protein